MRTAKLFYITLIAICALTIIVLCCVGLTFENTVASYALYLIMGLSLYGLDSTRKQ